MTGTIPVALLDACRAAGIRLDVVDGHLRYRAPQGTMTPGLRATLVAAKAELIPILEVIAAFTVDGIPPRIVPSEGWPPPGAVEARVWLAGAT